MGRNGASISFAAPLPVGNNGVVRDERKVQGDVSHKVTHTLVEEKSSNSGKKSSSSSKAVISAGDRDMSSSTSKAATSPKKDHIIATSDDISKVEKIDDKDIGVAKLATKEKEVEMERKEQRGTEELENKSRKRKADSSVEEEVEMKRPRPLVETGDDGFMSLPKKRSDSIAHDETPLKETATNVSDRIIYVFENVYILYICTIHVCTH